MEIFKSEEVIKMDDKEDEEGEEGGGRDRQKQRIKHLNGGGDKVQWWSSVAVDLNDSIHFFGTSSTFLVHSKEEDYAPRLLKHSLLCVLKKKQWQHRCRHHHHHQHCLAPQTQPSLWSGSRTAYGGVGFLPL